MPDNPRVAKKGGWGAVLIVALVLLPVLYVLSIGPAYRSLAYIYDLDTEFDACLDTVEELDVVYAPIWWVGDRWEPARKAICWLAGFEDVSVTAPPP